MNKAKQRKIEAREQRKESLSNWAETIDTRIADVDKKSKLDERLKRTAERVVAHLSSSGKKKIKLHSQAGRRTAEGRG